MDQFNPSIGVAVITHQAKTHLPYCLPPLLQSPLKPRVLVVNSSSQDGTVEMAEKIGAETLIIPRKEFNHGTTREKARKYLGTDIVVMMTPDAYFINEHMLEILVAPLIEKKVSVSYARQLPHENAHFFEAFSRLFNYPEKGHIRDLKELHLYQVYMFFCSNSCCAWLNQALDTIGGFEPVLLGEDTVALAKLLKKGHRVAYQAEALVKHSHRYTLKQEFQRHFDTGLARRQYETILEKLKDSQRGKKYVKEMFKKLVKEKPYLLPYAFLQTFIKWCGYQLGRKCLYAPKWVKQICSSQDFYWKNQS